MSTRAVLISTASAFLTILGCCPIIKKIAPELGPVGTEVVIDGERFESSPSKNTVTLGGVPVPTSDVLQASSLVR